VAGVFIFFDEGNLRRVAADLIAFAPWLLIECAAVSGFQDFPLRKFISL
jgi:hypothetical protein